MTSFEDIANATLKIECWHGRGLGSHFQREEIMVANFRVIKPYINQGIEIFGKTELGYQIELELLKYSSENEFNYTVLKMKDEIDEKRVALKPKCIIPTRGLRVRFSGLQTTCLSR